MRRLLLSVLVCVLLSCQHKQQGFSITTSSVGDISGIVEQMEHALVAIDVAAGHSDDSLRVLTKKMHREFMSSYPIFYDWWLQDGGDSPNWFDSSLRESIIMRLGRFSNGDLKLDGLSNNDLMDRYIELCIERRKQRLGGFLTTTRKIVYTKYHTLRPSFYGYTEGASDARGECNYSGGGALMLLTMDSIWAEERSLLESESGAFRDLDVHFDGAHLLFSWRKEAGDGDDYHLYEMDLNSRDVTAITDQERVVDIEGIYLPDDNILFNSTRCGSSVDCWFTEVSNLYICDREGQYIRRVGFDQVHTTAPTLLSDGRVVYTRWDYNDRGQVYTQPLFQMNYDGTMQQEFYGLNSWFPTTATHVKQIPGTRSVMATIIGHHTPQHGKLGVIDPEAGRDENEGVTLIAPISKPNNDRIDGWGQYGDQFQHPEPLNKTDFIVSYTPLGYYV